MSSSNGEDTKSAKLREEFENSLIDERFRSATVFPVLWTADFVREFKKNIGEPDSLMCYCYCFCCCSCSCSSR